MVSKRRLPGLNLKFNLSVKLIRICTGGRDLNIGLSARLRSLIPKSLKKYRHKTINNRKRIYY